MGPRTIIGKEFNSKRLESSGTGVQENRYALFDAPDTDVAEP